MQKKRHHYFRWSPRNAKITIMYMVVVPAIVGYAAYKNDVSGRRDSAYLGPKTPG